MAADPLPSDPSPHPPPQDAVALAHDHALEAARLVHAAWPTVVAAVGVLGSVVGVGLDPDRAAGGRVGDDAVEEGGGDAVASVGGCDDDAGDADDGGGFGAVGIDVAVAA